jgi:probable DNA repair protein
VDPDLIRLLADGAVVVTPNRRLARDLNRRFAETQIAEGRTAWPSPDVLPWGSWLERTFEELARFDAREQPLGADQESALWQQVIEESAFSGSLLDAVAAARIAREAWELQHAWRLNLTGWRGRLPEDSAAFLAWGTRFQERCASRGWLDSARLPDAVAQRLRLRPVRRPAAVILYGFDELTPQARSALEACRAAGLRVEVRRPAAGAGRVLHRAYVTAEDELADVARRVRGILLDDPAARVGVVIPDLARRRADVVRLFDDALEPARVISADRTRSRPYNLSLGLPLGGYPLVRTALLILRLARGELALHEAGVLLRSPFLAAAEHEFARRALLDARLRRRGRLTLPLTALRDEAHAAGAEAPHACRTLSARLDAWRPLAETARRLRQMPSAWSGTLLSLLAGLGWPGERTLDSEDYQTYVKWRDLVSGLSVLDAVVGPLDYDAALAWVARLCADTLFQPESEAVPVQVLGVLEAAGIEFDHLFVTGLHDEAWPAAARPNPLLPAALQRAHGVPHASAEWELAFARRMTALWRDAAREVALSDPARDGERALRASPLLADLPPAAPASGAVHPRWSYAAAIRAAARLEVQPDWAAPPLVPGYEVAGGIAVFRNQAACPFRAFAVHRLGADALEEGRPGLSAAERGTLLHEAARRLWGALGSHARLAAASDDARQTVIAQAVDEAIARLRRRRPDALTARFTELERRRLAALLGRLLALELQRPPFWVVEREDAYSREIAGLRVEARPDRVDRLDDGSHVVLDYKTGSAALPAWFGERPDEPQLPLYAIEYKGEVAGVSFVVLRPEEVAFKGLAREGDLLPGICTLKDVKAARDIDDWRALFDRWRAMRDALSGEFLAGHAPVAPKDYPNTCRFCELGALCRITELVRRAAEPEEIDPNE